MTRSATCRGCGENLSAIDLDAEPRVPCPVCGSTARDWSVIVTSSVTAVDHTARLMGVPLMDGGTVCDRLESSINDFGRLLDTNPEEEEVQRYLMENKVLLAPSALNIRPKVALGSEHETDFVVELLQHQYVLVEIERPSHRLFTKRGDPRAQLTHAQRQAEDWRDWVHQHISYARASMPGITDPDCWVIIGRRTEMSERDQAALTRKNRELQHIDIRTYDDLLDAANQHLENLRRL